MKRVISAILVLAMALSISDVFALPLSAEGIYMASSEVVTTAPEESPALPETATTLPEAEDIMQGATDPVPEVTEPTPEVTEPTPEVTDPTSEATNPDPVDDSASEDLPLAAGDIVDSGYCGDKSNGGDGTNLTWTLDGAGTLTISGSGKMCDYNFITLPPYQKYRSQIKYVILMSGVTNICNFAFSGCTGLTSVTIQDSVTSIGNYAFYGCTSLTSVTIPSSVTSIGVCAFYDCFSLTAFEVDSYNSSYCSIGGVLFSKDKTEIICYPAGRKDVSYIVSDSVTSIGEEAFSCCTSLTSIEVDVNNSAYCSIDGVLFSKDKTEIICYPAGRKDTSYIIPNGVTIIGGDAFSYNESLTSITIPNSVIGIGGLAFCKCTSLISVTIPDNVKSIGISAFYGCTSLTSVKIPNSVTSLGFNVFYGCISLTSVIIQNGVTSIGSWAFSECTSLTDIYCEAEAKPSGWVDNWQGVQNPETGTQAKVHWGYKDSSADITAEGFCGGEGDGTNLSWTLTGDGTLTISGSGKMADFTLQWGQNPNIVPWNQYLYSIKNVIIDEGVTSVGDRAFEDGKNIASVTIPDSVTAIGFSAFSNCHSLSNIFIPNSVTLIETTAFSRCSLLKTIELAPNNDYYHMDSNCLIETKTCTLIKGFDDSVIPDDGSVKVIANSAFSYCEKITTIKVPSSVTSIRDDFLGCKNLTTITVDPNNMYYYMDGNCLMEITTGTLIKGFNDSDIPNNGSVKSIGSAAFFDCSLITNITIPDSVTSIKSVAFFGCENLTDVTIPHSVTSIGNQAFAGCTSLKSIVIPKSVTKVNGYLFDSCSSLIDIYCEAESKPVGWQDYWISWDENINPTVTWGYKGAFGDILASGYCGGEGYGANLKWVLDGEGTLTISGQGKMADWSENINLRPWNDISGSISSVILKDGVTSVGAAAFYNCKNLTSITIPSTVTNIETYALAACAGLASVTIPNGVTSIGKYAFIKCNALTSVTIPGSVAIISEQAFGSCSGLTSVTILSGVTAIERCAFLRCSSLTSITIPGSVTSIGDFAFQECASLTSATIEDGVTSIGKYAFSVCPALTSVTIPDSVISIGEHTFWKSSKLTSITIPSGVTSIGDLSFWGCTALSAIEVDSANQEYCSIDGVLFSKDMSEIICYPAGKIDSSYAIPNGVKSIRGSAFAGSSKLTSITIPDSVASIGDYAFNSCGLTSVVIPESVEIMGKGAFVWCRQLNNIRCEAKTKPDGWNEDWQGSQNSQTGAKAEVTWSSTSSEFVPGDVSGDNKLNNQDAIHLLKHVMNSAQYTINQNADMNGDGKVNNQDAIYLLKHILNPASYPLKN